jgi:tetratricopeptide (TPR) repeat protein
MNTRNVVVLVLCTICAVSAGGTGCAPRRAATDPAEAKPSEPLAAQDLYVEGAQAYRRGERDKALIALREAVRQNPNLRMAQAMLGDIYRTKGDYQNAAVHYEVATKLDPYTLSNHYNLGVVYQLLRRFQEAAASYLRALDLNPRDLKANMNLGTVYLALGDLDESVNYLERATMLDPTSAEAWSNLGVAYDARGKTTLAEQAYNKALELDASATATLQNLGSNLVSQGKAAEAIAIMKDVTSRANTASAHKRYGDALALGRQYDAALSEYTTALNLDANYYPAMNEKAFVLLRQYKAGMELDEEKLKQAIALWKVSLRINPRQPRIQDALRTSERPGLSGT